MVNSRASWRGWPNQVLLSAGLDLPDAGENGSSTAGVSTIQYSPLAPERARDPNGQFAACEAALLQGCRAAIARPMLNDRSSILSLLETRRSGKPRDLVGPGPTPEELERMLTIAARTPDHGKLTPWRFVTVGGRSARRVRGALLQQALAEDDPDAPPAKHQKEHDFAHYQGALVVLVSAPVAGPQDPAVGAGTVVRRGGDEPAARGACPGLCRRLGDRLARLFGARPRAPSASPASGSPASSSSATPAASSKSGRGPSWRQCSERVAAARTLSLAIELSRDPLYYDSMTLRTQHDKPVYVRLRETIADAILAGKYGDGDPLPSVRALAAEEQANPADRRQGLSGLPGRRPDRRQARSRHVRRAGRAGAAAATPSAASS